MLTKLTDKWRASNHGILQATIPVQAGNFTDAPENCNIWWPCFLHVSIRNM